MRHCRSTALLAVSLLLIGNCHTSKRRELREDTRAGSSAGMKGHGDRDLKPEHKELFDLAARSRGPAYLDAKAKLLEIYRQVGMPADLRAEVDSPVPDRALVARILIGQTDRPAAYNKAEQALRGEYQREKYWRGEIRTDDSSWRESEARNALGADAVFLGLEALLKSRAFTEESSLGWKAAFATVEHDRDPRWNELILSALGDEGFNDREKLTFAEFLLLEMADKRAMPFVRSALVPPFRSVPLVCDSISVLAAAHDSASEIAITQLALNASVENAIRQAAVEAISEMNPADAETVLLKVLRTAPPEDEPFLLAISHALGAVGDTHALPAVRRIRRQLKWANPSGVDDDLARIEARSR